MWWNTLITRLREWGRKSAPTVQGDLVKAFRFARSSPWLPGALISFGVALVIAFSVDWKALEPILARPAWWLLVGAIFFYFNATACRALILPALTSEQVGYSQSLFTQNEGALVNILLPLRLGDNGQAFLLARRQGLDEYVIRSAIRVERFFDAFIVVGLLIASLLISNVDKSLKLVLLGILLLMVIFLFSIPRLAQPSDRLTVFSKWFAESFSWVGPNFQPKALSFFTGLSVLSDPAVLGTSLLWSALAWAFRITGLFTLIKGVAPVAPFGFGVFVAGVLAISTRLPSAPAALGVYEGVIILALFLVGVDPTTAFACALISHFIDILLPLIVGGAVFILEVPSLTGLYKQLT